MREPAYRALGGLVQVALFDQRVHFVADRTAQSDFNMYDPRECLGRDFYAAVEILLPRWTMYRSS